MIISVPARSRAIHILKLNIMKIFKNILPWATIMLLVGSAIYYSILTVLEVILPVIATFIIAFIYFAISEATYWANAKKKMLETGEKISIWNNIAMHAGFVNVTIVTIAVIGTALWKGNFVTDFNSFHYFCLGLSAFILFIWKVTKNPVLSFLLMQLIAIIAYLPMFSRVLTMDIQTESNVMWIAILLASITAIPKVIKGYKEQKDWLGFVYVGRVIPINLILVYLVFAKDYGLYPFI